MKKKAFLLGAAVLVFLLLLGGYLWIRTDVPEMEFTYPDGGTADWRLDKNGVAAVCGSGTLPWLEAEYRYRLYTQEKEGSLYAYFKRRFDYCPIKKVVIGKNVTPDLSEAPADSYGLHLWDGGLREIEVEAGNPYFSCADGVLYNRDRTVLLSYPTERPAKTFAVPDGVTAIAKAAFRFNARLVSVTLPEGLAEIRAFAFQYAKRLKNVSLPEGLKAVGEYAFFECRSLRSVYVPASAEDFGNYALGFRIKNSFLEGGDNAPVKGFRILCSADAPAKAYAEANGVVWKPVG